jgi:23S rRNA (uracil1939-C5)-methyltransferase
MPQTQLLQIGKLKKTQDALAHVNLYPKFRPIINSKKESRRRATFAAKRTKKGSMVGFHSRASDIIVEVTECPVSDPILLSGIPAFSQFAILVHLENLFYEFQQLFQDMAWM